jgi:hypothetical protein
MNSFTDSQVRRGVMSRKPAGPALEMFGSRKRILQRMGLDEPAIEVSVAYFRDHGGYCDCEVLLNVAHAL